MGEDLDEKEVLKMKNTIKMREALWSSKHNILEKAVRKLLVPDDWKNVAINYWVEYKGRPFVWQKADPWDVWMEME